MMRQKQVRLYISFCDALTVSDIICSDVEELARKCGISYKVLLSIRKVLFAQCAPIPISGANLYKEVIASVAILPTGCQSIDKLLDGGFYTCELLEVAGPTRSGKTQFCLTAAASFATQSSQNVLYVDTTGGFSPQRLQEIMAKKGCTLQVIREALKKIQCKQVFDIFELLELLEDIRGCLEQGQEDDRPSVRMVIVDSVSALMAPLLGGNQVDGQALLHHLAQALKILSVEFYTAVMVTNNVVQGDSAEDVKPALGRSWLGVPHSRLMLRYKTANSLPGGGDYCGAVERCATLVKSQRQPTGRYAPFVISGKGVTDS
ncbi:DNA repair protein RAD51-like 4 [Holothuria leucospilota]|uniref:DNA repair protein RAD51-like 4 n=1 Tax=Holothuria leucospilota TaxID=206669 RepID=A0A9Q1HF30_HOLLE|nr:DNA repair protein RAD51-like 4 [Holothuria leucospilota]